MHVLGQEHAIMAFAQILELGTKTKSCTEWGSFGIRTCSLCLAVQDGKHNLSSNGK